MRTTGKGRYRNRSWRVYVRILRYEVTCCLYMSSKYLGKPMMSLQEWKGIMSKPLKEEEIITFEA